MADRHGFTLLEVLAAVALLGLVYTVLASSGIQGLRAEGEASRRLHASMLADSTLASIEAKIDEPSDTKDAQSDETDNVPPIGETETTQGEFTVKVTVAPFTLVVPELPSRFEAQKSPQPSSSGDAFSSVEKLAVGGTGTGTPAGSGPSLLGANTLGSDSSPLRRIDVTVLWTDGAVSHEVSRTTFALDKKAAHQTLDALDQTSSSQTGSNGQSGSGAGANSSSPGAGEAPQ